MANVGRTDDGVRSQGKGQRNVLDLGAAKYVIIVLFVSGMCHLGGRLGYHLGLYSYATSDAFTLAAVVGFFGAANVSIHRVYGVAFITWTTIVATVLVVVGQGFNVWDNTPLWGGVPALQSSGHVLVKEICFISGIILLVGSFLLSILESHRAKMALQEAYAVVEAKVDERTMGLRQANLQLEAEIADRKAMEMALRLSEERFRSVLSQYKDGLTIVDQTGGITEWNQAMEEITGLSSQKVIGCPLWDVVWSLLPDTARTEAMKERVREDIFRRLAGGAAPSRTGEYMIRAMDGQSKLLQSVMFRVHTSGGPILCGHARDITRQHELETQLRQTHKMEAIGVLAGGIAHDFNNILMILLGHADMAIEEPSLPPRIAEHLQSIRKAGRRARDLVKQILAFSREHQQELSVIPVYLPVQETLKLLRATLPTTIDIQLDIDDSTGCTLADPSQIQQVVMNLCTNAFQAMEGKTGLLQVSLQLVELKAGELHHDAKDGLYHRLCVRDTGCGIPNEIIGRIFDPFFTTKPVGRGTGLGLATVHGIVHKCGGFITIGSEVGKGSAFNVYLPQVKGIPAGVEEDAQIQGGNGRGHIMVIDDEEEITAMIKQVLEARGFTVHNYTSSAAALADFSARPESFDLILTDQTMPGFTGMELAQHALTIRSDTPIILFTGFSDAAIPEITQELGIRKCLLKPVTPQALLQAITDALR